MTDYAMVMTTAENQEDARAIAQYVVGKKLAACVQLLSIESIYTWKDEVCQDPEVLLLMKTRSALYPDLEAAIREIHKYETPEILRVPVEAGFGDYLKWVDDVTS